MNRRTRRLLGTAAGAGLAGAAMRLQQRRDMDAVSVDALAAELTTDALPPSRELQVESSDGAPLHVTVTGPDDAPAVVLAHGWTCSSAFWVRQIRSLSRELRLITFDQRGHGRSVARRGVLFGVDQLADDLDAVLTATLRPGERAVLVGHSMGSMSIVAWAGRHPERVERVAAAALLTSTGIAELRTSGALLPIPRSWRWLNGLLGWIFLCSPAPLGPPSPVARRVIRHITLARHASPATVEFVTRMILRCPTRVRVAWGATLARLDLRDAAARLTVPATVLVGAADRLTPPPLSHRLAEALPNLDRLVEVPDVAHMTPLEAAEAVDGEIRRLVATHLPVEARA